jgi:hypothetical protein
MDREAAEESCDRVFRGVLANNPVLGTISNSVYRETQPQRWERLELAVAEILNS